jgi:hypothetical protein
MTASPYRTVIEAMFRIVDKKGAAVDFRLTDVQAELDAGWSRRNIIPKARQTKVSSYVIARYTAKCLAEQNRTCVIISHETEATQRLLGRANYILSNLKGGVKPDLGRSNRNEIFFKKTNSTFYIGTAGARAFGHGDTITDLHLSEPSRYTDPERVVQGVMPAAEAGEVTAESTGNGMGNWFHRQCVRAREGIGFKLFFFSWTRAPEYALPFATEEDRAAFASSLRDDWLEPQLFADGVTLEQLQWRRERLNIDFEGDLRTFQEAYPYSFDECFQSTGYGFFRRVTFSEEGWHRESALLHILGDHPKPGLSYVIGGDPAGGVGKDNSVLEVFCLDTSEQVAEWASSLIEPPEFADAAAALGRRFNNAYINIERNNHGGTTLARLTQCYPLELIHRGSRGELSPQAILSHLSHFGTATTASSRGLILGTARRLLSSEFTIHSPLLKSELSTFVEKDDGKIEADAGCLDDRVMATAMALIVVEQAGVASASSRETEQPLVERNPFSFDALFENFGKVVPRFGTPERFH